MWTLLSVPLINGALISATFISSISVWNSWYTFDILDVFLRNRSILSRWRSTSNNELWRTLEMVKFLWLTPFIRLGKVPQKSFHFGLYVCLCSFYLNKFCFFVTVALKGIPSLWNVTLLFCINFLYLKVTCH